MEELQRAIENITYYQKKFPREELELIGANRDAAIPYLRDAVEKALREKENLDQEYGLHFYGVYLLAQFQDRAFFPKLMELASLPEDTLDFLVGDTITEGMRDILYNTYNGQLELLKQAVLDKRASDFSRAAMLNVMAQLYSDQILGKQEWQDFLREIVYKEESIGDDIYTDTAELICRCHFTEMFPELRRLYQDKRVDEFVIGGYDSCVDRVFAYRKREERFCQSQVDAVKMLSGWAMFEDSAEARMAEADEDDRRMADSIDEFDSGFGNLEQAKNVKIGRNDPCPCGSGKKYKHCCLNKSWITAKGVESVQEQERWLSEYPPAAVERKDGRVYLEDLYSNESIEIDKLLYLALKHRVIPIWKRESEQVVSNRKRGYLTLAFQRFQEIIARENIPSFSEYDSKYAIHYSCDQWITELMKLLKENDSDGMLKDVYKVYKNMRM